MREWESLGSGFEAPSGKRDLNRRTEMTLASKSEAERLKGCGKGGAQPNRRKGALVGEVGESRTLYREVEHLRKNDRVYLSVPP